MQYTLRRTCFSQLNSSNAKSSAFSSILPWFSVRQSQERSSSNTKQVNELGGCNSMSTLATKYYCSLFDKQLLGVIATTALNDSGFASIRPKLIPSSVHNLSPHLSRLKSVLFCLFCEKNSPHFFELLVLSLLRGPSLQWSHRLNIHTG